jgi:Cof subfamily protein (haloacid dehalogenase superfamily)
MPQLATSAIEIVFIDLDGTLVSKSDTISPENILAIKKSQLSGVVFVLCTGRIPYMAEPVAAQIGRTGYGVFSNGSVILNWETSQILLCKPLSLEMAKRAAEIAFAQGVAPLYFGCDIENDLGVTVYADTRVALVPEYLERNVHRIVYTDLTSTGFTKPPTTVEFLADRETVFNLLDILRREFGESATLNTGYLPRYESWLVGLNAAGVSKAASAQVLIDHLGIPHSAAMAIGDQSNDIDLLRWAAMGVCMGDGSEEAQSAADYITGTFEQNGVAQALEKFILARFEYS